MNRKVTSLLTLCLIVVLAVVAWSNATRAVRAAAWTEKVDLWVVETAARQGTTEFLVYLSEQADLSGAAMLPTKTAKGSYVYEQLTAVAARTQPAVTAQLDSLGVAYRPYWVANLIWVRGDLNAIQAMAQRDDVAHLYANPTVRLEPLPPVNEADLIAATQTVEWNIALVNAPDVWAAGYTGQGVVIGGQDTGYDWDHPALINQYRGWNGTTADHNYNWHDAIHSNDPHTPSGNVCGFDSSVPCDDYGHGTHTMGTMVGDDGGTNQIGMAPGAKWIGCRNMEDGWGTPTSYTECYQWFIAPTDLNGQNPDPAAAPHVISNSWGCPPSEGCTDPNLLLTIVNNVRAAGIVTVHSAGNSGSACSTVNTPSAIYDASYSVGATNSSDVIAGFSSRGPVTVDGSGRAKPDISAPGVGIRSSVPEGGYSLSSGTSMAAPHVAGLVALLVSASPPLAGQVDEIEYIINQTAVPLTTSQGCGGDGPTDVPNNVYGWGRIDALAAYNALGTQSLTLTKTASAAAVAPGEIITYTLTVVHNHPISSTHNVILTDTIPANTTFITATLPHTINGDTVQWETAELLPGASWHVDLAVQVWLTATGTITNSAYGVRSDEAAAIGGPPVTTPVVPYSLSLEKTAVTTVMPDEILTYTITVGNAGSLSAVHNLVLTDVLPANTVFITATQPHSFDGTMVRWELSSLDVGETWAVELVVQVPLTATGSIENVDYAVSSDETTAVTGAPVTTIIANSRLYLPIINKP